MNAFVDWFRHSAPYINAHRGRTFVVAFGGELVADPAFAHFVHDIALLDSLGVRLVLVHGARPQIEERLREDARSLRYVGDVPVTDADAVECVSEAVGRVRLEIEARLSMGVANSPMAGAKLRVASGNFVTARPLGVRDGIDFAHTGEVRRIDAEGIRSRLDTDAIVLLSPVGYSPTGEVFHLGAEDVATATSIALRADKLLTIVESPGVLESRRLVHQISPVDAERIVRSRRRLPPDISTWLRAGVRAAQGGVRRIHLIDRHVDGAILLELFTREGVGTMITGDLYEGMRPASIDDVGGILGLIEPLEREGVLVKRSRKRLEMEIDRFTVIERDRAIIACGALYVFAEDRIAEVACLAVHPEYRGTGRGDALLEFLERKARSLDIERVVVLTTQAAHWFRERGYEPARVADLPVDRRGLYNLARNSKVFAKPLEEEKKKKRAPARAARRAK